MSTRQLYRSNNQPASYAALTQFAPEPQSHKDKEAAAQHLAEAQKNLVQTVTTASKETVKEEKKRS